MKYGSQTDFSRKKDYWQNVGGCFYGFKNISFQLFLLVKLLSLSFCVFFQKGCIFSCQEDSPLHMFPEVIVLPGIDPGYSSSYTDPK